MRRILSVLTAIAAALHIQTHAADVETYMATPISIAPGIVAIDSLPLHIESCDLHFRVELPRSTKHAEWAVTFCYPDSSVSITLSRDGLASADSHFALPLEVSVSTEKACNGSMSISDGIDASCDGWSTVITYLPGTEEMLVRIGQRNALHSLRMAARGLRHIVFAVNTPMKLSRHSFFVKERDAHPWSHVSSMAELRQRLNTPSRPTVETQWQYLDRDSDPRLISMGGNYTLATLTSPDGTIEIIYLSGAQRNSGKWHPLMLKGRLIPTAFENHYDLVWYDTSGTKLDLETSADIIDGSILRLNMPLYGGSFRFRRSTMPADGQNL